MDRNINEAYGTVSIEVFDQMRADREKLADTSVGDTLGQYWEVALEPDGLDRELFFRFSASCSECGLKAVIEETHELWKPEDLA